MRAVGGVEDVDERLQPARLREVGLLDDRRELAFEDRLDLLDHLGRGAVHLGDAQRDVALQLLGQRAQHHRAGVGVHVREDERDRLRVLVLEVGEHLAGVGAAQELERRRDHRDAEVVEDLVGLAAAEARLEQLARGRVAALRHVGARGVDLGELVEHLFDLVDLEMVEARDLRHDLGDLLLAQRPQHRGRALLARLHEQDRSLLGAGELLRHALRPPVGEPGAQGLRDFVGLAFDEIGDLALDRRRGWIERGSDRCGPRPGRAAQRGLERGPALRARAGRAAPAAAPGCSRPA